MSTYLNVKIDLHGIHTKYLSVNHLASRLRHGVFYFQVFLPNFFTHILQVTLPQYQHLMAMEKKLMRLEAMMKKISDKSDPDTLQNNPKWNALIKMRDMLTKYVPRMQNLTEE